MVASGNLVKPKSLNPASMKLKDGSAASALQSTAASRISKVGLSGDECHEGLMVHEGHMDG